MYREWSHFLRNKGTNLFFSLYWHKKREICRKKKRKTKERSSYQYCEYTHSVYSSPSLLHSLSLSKSIYIHSWVKFMLPTHFPRLGIVNAGRGRDREQNTGPVGWYRKVCGRLQCRGNSYNLGANHPSDSWRCSSPISCFHYDPPQLWILIEPSPVPYPFLLLLPHSPITSSRAEREGVGGFRSKRSDSVIRRPISRPPWSRRTTHDDSELVRRNSGRDSIKRLIKSGICSTFNAQARVDQLYVNPGRKSGASAPSSSSLFSFPLRAFARPSFLPPPPPPRIFYPSRISQRNIDDHYRRVARGRWKIFPPRREFYRGSHPRFEHVALLRPRVTWL